MGAVCKTAGVAWVGSGCGNEGCVMSALIGNVLRRRGLSPDNMRGRSDAAVLMSQVLEEVEALRQRNASFAADLMRQLSGNAGKVELKPEPDGLGFFYGSYFDEHGRQFRLDVMPPRELWTGDVGEQAASDSWIVYVNGEELARAPAIDGLSTVASVMSARDE